MRAFKHVRSAAFSFLISVLPMNIIGTTAADATQSLSVLVGPICIWVFDIAEDLPPKCVLI